MEVQKREREEEGAGERDNGTGTICQRANSCFYSSSRFKSRKSSILDDSPLHQLLSFAFYFCSLSLLGKGSEYNAAYSKQLMSEGKKNTHTKPAHDILETNK